MKRQRLLNVAKACRESPHPEKFTMFRIMHACGTPACAFGHYAAREDLQDEFSLLNPKCLITGSALLACDGVALRNGSAIGYDTGETAIHFDLPHSYIEELFGMGGCGGAKNAIEAAAYIERFVTENEAENPRWSAYE